MVVMGFSKKQQPTGTSVRTSLKPIATKARPKEGEEDGGEEDSATTPTAKESRIPERLPCPPAPRKRPPTASSTGLCRGVREFFNPPDLESVFKYHAERAK